MSSSRIHHTEVSQRDQLGITLGWISLAGLVVGLLGLAGNAVFSWWIYAALGIGGVFGIAYLSIRKDAALAALTSPNSRYRANTGLFLVGVFGILVLANYIAGRHYKQFDLTKNSLNSLSPQTKEVVKNLKEDVTVTAFYATAGARGADGQRVKDMLRQYKELSPKLKFELIDPVADPAKALAKAGSGPDSTGMAMVPSNVVWFESGGRKESVYNVGEKEFSSAILKVTRPTKKKVYFLYGHGEGYIDGSDETSLSAIKRYLTDVNYDVSRLVLMTTKTVPTDAALVVIAGLHQALNPKEQTALSDYLNQGGKMLLLLGFKQPVPTQLLGNWGIEVGSTMISDPSNPQFAVVQRFETHPVTRQCQLAVLPTAVPVTAAGTPPAGVTVTSVLKAQDSATGEVSVGVVATKGETPPQQPGMPPPPAPSPDQKSSRVVVLGSASVMNDQGVMSYGRYNKALILNTLNWLAEEDALVNIPPKDPESPPVTLMPQQARWIRLVSLLIMPLGVLLFGVGVWWRRR